jgi:carbamate kinase
MGSKVEAAAQFVESSGGAAIITSPEEVMAAVEGEAGTHITRDGSRAPTGSGSK